jgi:hypothetical protein
MDEHTAAAAVQEMLSAIGESLDASSVSYIADTLVDDPEVPLEDVLGALLPFDKLHDACQRLSASIRSISDSSTSVKPAPVDESLPVKLATQVTIGAPSHASDSKKAPALQPQPQAPAAKEQPTSAKASGSSSATLQRVASPELGKIEALDLVSSMEGRKEDVDDSSSDEYEDEDRFDAYREDMDAGFFGSQNSRFAIDRTGCSSKQVHLKGLFLAFRFVCY